MSERVSGGGRSMNEYLVNKQIALSQLSNVNAFYLYR